MHMFTVYMYRIDTTFDLLAVTVCFSGEGMVLERANAIVFEGRRLQSVWNASYDCHASHVCCNVLLP